MIHFVAWLIASSVLCRVAVATEYGYKRPVTYAGPIIYSDEKPPIINFPGPPATNTYSKDSSTGSGYGGYGYGETKGNGITYVPLPLDDLPILIYQSKDKPPIHVINRPSKDVDSSGYGSSASNYNALTSGSYGATGYAGSPQSYPPPAGYGSPPAATATYGGGYGNSIGYGMPAAAPPSASYVAPKPVYVPKPTAPSAVYLPPTKPQYSATSYGSSANYGNYGSGSTYASGSSYGNSMSYTNGGSSYGSGYSAPPHIIYSGHPPIHVYQQPSVYNQPPSPPSSSYGSSSGAGGVTGNYGASYGGSGYAGSSYSGTAYGGSYGYGGGSKPFYSASYGGVKQPQPYSKPTQQQQTYVAAPPGYHKPPIIIYQGVRPPVHVYSEPAPPSTYDGYSYSAKHGAEWEPLKGQDGQVSNSISGTIDSDAVAEEQEVATSDSSSKDQTTEQVSPSL